MPTGDKPLTLDELIAALIAVRSGETSGLPVVLDTGGAGTFPVAGLLLETDGTEIVLASWRD